jgi:hypothetical protein
VRSHDELADLAKLTAQLGEAEGAWPVQRLQGIVEEDEGEVGSLDGQHQRGEERDGRRVELTLAEGDGGVRLRPAARIFNLGGGPSLGVAQLVLEVDLGEGRVWVEPAVDSLQGGREAGKFPFGDLQAGAFRCIRGFAGLAQSSAELLRFLLGRSDVDRELVEDLLQRLDLLLPGRRGDTRVDVAPAISQMFGLGA